MHVTHSQKVPFHMTVLVAKIDMCVCVCVFVHVRIQRNGQAERHRHTDRRTEIKDRYKD